jgi:hypothetical protein
VNTTTLASNHQFNYQIIDPSASPPNHIIGSGGPNAVATNSVITLPSGSPDYVIKIDDVPGGVNMDFFATRTSCMAPCAIEFSAQATENLGYNATTGGNLPYVVDSKFVWDFDNPSDTVNTEGFLAATVYETPGVYHPTLMVNGQLWNTKTITVTGPNVTRCVCNDGSCEGCPGTSYTSLSAALSGIPSNSWVLIQGNGATSTQTMQSVANVAIKGYDFATSKPTISFPAGFRIQSGQSLVDLTSTSCGADPCIDTQFSNTTNILLLRFNTATPAPGDVIVAVYPTNGIFVIDSDLRSGGPNNHAMFVGELNQTVDVCDHLVIKNSRIELAPGAGTGGMAIRVQSCDNFLAQNSAFPSVGVNALTLRGFSYWALVQGNYFSSCSGAGPQNCDPGNEGEEQRYLVWEQNVFEGPGGVTSSGQGQYFKSRDITVRNNVSVNSGQWGFKAEKAPGGCTVEPTNVHFLNNTTILLTEGDAGTEGTHCDITGTCEIRNSTTYSTTSCACHVGGTRSDNWCYCNGSCIENPGGTGSCNPSFLNTDPGSPTSWPGSPDFARPASGTVGINSGLNSVPVWNDYFNAPRNDGNLDVGAVER